MRIRSDVAALLRAGHTSSAVAAQVGLHPATVRQARKALGITPGRPGPRPPATLEEFFLARVEELPDGHMRWLPADPELRFQQRNYSARRAAFRIRTGRDPIGRVLTSCNMPQCVAPAHVADRVERDRDAAVYAAVFGDVL